MKAGCHNQLEPEAGDITLAVDLSVSFGTRVADLNRSITLSPIFVCL